MDRLLAKMSPDDAAAALRLIRLLEECGQMMPVEAAEWILRIAGWTWFNAVKAEAAPSA
jgi:hypothetical protein